MKTQEEILKIIEGEIEDLQQSLNDENKWLSIAPDYSPNRDATIRSVNSLSVCIQLLKLLKAKILCPNPREMNESVTKFNRDTLDAVIHESATILKE